DPDPFLRPPERGSERAARELRRVAFPRKMRGDDVRQVRRVDARENRRRRLVVQMPEAPGDALLERVEIVAVREHLEIVVALEHQRVATGEARLDVPGGDAD